MKTVQFTAHGISGRVQIATASSKEKQNLALKLGAERVVDLQYEPWPAEVRKSTVYFRFRTRRARLRPFAIARFWANCSSAPAPSEFRARKSFCGFVPNV